MLWMHEKYHTPLVDILQQHADVIAAMFFGHDHADGFKILPNKNGIYFDLLSVSASSKEETIAGEKALLCSI